MLIEFSLTGYRVMSLPGLPFTWFCVKYICTVISIHIGMNVFCLISKDLIGIGLIGIMSIKLIGIGIGTIKIFNRYRYRYDNRYSEIIGIGICMIIGIQN